MSKPAYIFLLIVLLLNTIRYAGSLLEGKIDLYFIILFKINLIAVVLLLAFHKRAIRQPE